MRLGTRKATGGYNLFLIVTFHTKSTASGKPVVIFPNYMPSCEAMINSRVNTSQCTLFGSTL